MTAASNQVSIDAFTPHPIFMGGAQVQTTPAPRPPIVSDGPPLARPVSATALSGATNSSPAANCNREETTEVAHHLEAMMRHFPWFSLTEVCRPSDNNFAQLLFDDGLLNQRVSDYFTFFDQFNYVYQLNFHYGTNSNRDREIREDGFIREKDLEDLRQAVFFEFSASQARSFGTCVIRGRLDRDARVGEVADKKQSWHLLCQYYACIVESFCREKHLTAAQKSDLQNHLLLRVLEGQKLDAVVVDHPQAAWKSLLVLNAEMMVLEFN